MLMRPIDEWYLQKEEPAKSCLQYLRNHILSRDGAISEAWKYRMPIFFYHGRMFCYLWIHKKYQQPYLGIVEGNKIQHPELLQENRAKMKILLIDPSKDIPIGKIDVILDKLMLLYKKPVKRS